MKAIKSCINKECDSSVHKIKYKDNYVFCPLCGERLTYVCADCWQPLEHSTERYCPDCAKKREELKEERQQKLMDKGAQVAKTASTITAAVVTVVKHGNQIMKVIKK